MRKLFLASAILTITGMTAYADGDSALSLTQINIVDYLIYGGLALLLVGAVFILLSLFLKSSSKSDIKANDVNNALPEDDIPSDNEHPSESSDNTADECDDNDAATESEVDGDIISESENFDDGEGSAADDCIENELESEAEPEAESNAEPEAENEAENDNTDSEAFEEPPVPSIRLTLTGMNNPDLKILEFSESATIGRRSANDLIISDNAVSGTHCRLTYNGDVVCIEDLNSTNGTMVNGESVTAAEIKSGDILILGKQQYKINIS